MRSIDANSAIHPAALLILLLAAAVILSGCSTDQPTANSPAGEGAANQQATATSLSSVHEILWLLGSDQMYNLSAIAGKGIVLSGCAVSSGALPPWISLDKDSCVFSGTAPPLDAGTAKKVLPRFSILASGNATFEISLTVVSEAPELISVDSNYCTAGKACSVEIARAEKGAPPYSFYSDSFATGAPPMGTTISLDGKLKGVVSDRAEGRYRFGVCAADSNRASGCGMTQIIIQKKPAAALTPAAASGRNFTLTVKPAGEGKGNIMADRGLLLCGQTSVGIAGACSASYGEGTRLILYATPFERDGSSFREWGGDCSGEDDCAITIDSDKSVTATFDVGASATVDSASCTFITKSSFKEYDEYVFEVRGSGTVTGPPGSEFKIFTGYDAIQNIRSWTGLPQREGTKAKRAYADDPKTAAWSSYGQIGARDYLDGTAPQSVPDLVGVHVYEDGDAEDNPSVVKIEPVKCVKPDNLAHIVKVNVTRYGDKGKVTSVRSGIDCGIDCAYGFLKGDNITLLAEPATGYSFGGWSGDCEGKGPCILQSLDVDKYVAATFSDYWDAHPSQTTTTVGAGTTKTAAPSGGGDYSAAIDSINCRLISTADEYGSTRYHRELTASGTASGPENSKLVVSVRGINGPAYPIGLDGDFTMSSSWKQSEGGYGFSSMQGYRYSGYPASTSWSVVETDISSVCGGAYPPCADLQMGIRATIYRDGAFEEASDEKWVDCPS